MTNEQVDLAFEALHEAQRQAQLLYMDLRDAGNQAGAADAKARINQLQRAIDTLINKELDDWQAGAEQVISELSDAADAVQKAVDSIARDVRNAQKIADAMKLLDKAITVGMKFIA